MGSDVIDNGDHRMINRILIKNKRELNKTDGSYSLFGTTNPTIAETTTDDDMTTIHGYLINTNLQHSLVLDIEVEETESTFNPKLV